MSHPPDADRASPVALVWPSSACWPWRSERRGVREAVRRMGLARALAGPVVRRGRSRPSPPPRTGYGQGAPAPGRRRDLRVVLVVRPGDARGRAADPRDLRGLTDEIAASFGSFPELVAPGPATTGFLVVVAAALWIIAELLRPGGAEVPGTGPGSRCRTSSTFAAVGILARNEGRTTAALCSPRGSRSFAASQRFLSGHRRRWVGGRRLAGVADPPVSGSRPRALALVAGLRRWGPDCPADADPVIDLRELGRGSGPRTVVSPFVGIALAARRAKR